MPGPSRGSSSPMMSLGGGARCPCSALPRSLPRVLGTNGMERETEGRRPGKTEIIGSNILSILEFWQVVILGYVHEVYDCCELGDFYVDSDCSKHDPSSSPLSVHPSIRPSIHSSIHASFE